jgi:hypothetical protein
MRTITLPIAILVLAMLASSTLVLAQDKAPPPTQDQVRDAQKQHSGPPPDRSLPDQNATQEPSAKVIGSNPRPEALWHGMLTVAGAPQDADTIPSLYSPRTASDDKLPIVAYTLKHLTNAQRSALRSELANGKPAPAAGGSTAYAVVGGEVPPRVALEGFKALPHDIVSKLPEMRGVAYMVSADKVLLIDADNRVVVGVL